MAPTPSSSLDAEANSVVAKRHTKRAEKERKASATTFSMRLREARMKLGQSHGDAARALGVTREGYGRLERGRVLPRADVLLRVAKLFNVSTDWLLGLRD